METSFVIFINELKSALFTIFLFFVFNLTMSIDTISFFLVYVKVIHAIVTKTPHE